MLVDVHAHYFPLKYVAGAPQDIRHLLGPLASQTVEQRLDLMDEAGVDVQVLSPAHLVPYFADETRAAEAARTLNTEYAELAALHPKRFKAYASLPMPHMKAALREMEYALNQLGCSGVTLGCSILNRPVTDEEFTPLYDEMNRRGTIVFFHPVVNGLCSPLLNDFNLAGSVGTTMEDTVVALHLIVRQFPHRYPSIRIIIPHLGGLLPMLINRIDNQVSATYKGLPERPGRTARRFWYDTVAHGSHAALRCACEAFGPDRLLPGSDYPVLLPYETYKQTFAYIREAGLPDNAAERVIYRNAATLFGL
jgi:6-methylsalicylate decarboxylase